MMRTGTNLLLASALAACLLHDPSTARAESRDATTVALGWQAENADAIVVATIAAAAGAQAPGAAADVEFRVEEVIKAVDDPAGAGPAVAGGALLPGASLVVAQPEHGHGSPWRAGQSHLLFLRRAQAVAPLPAPGAAPAPALYEPLSGAFSIRPLPAGSAEARFPQLVRSLRQVLDARDEARLRALLVSWMEDADPGVAWSAAVDFVRHDELHAALAPEERARIVAAYVRQPIGKNTKEALALAAAATRSPEAVQALVDSLSLDGAARIRGAVSEALRRLDHPSAETLLVASLKAATPAQQPALLGALAVVGGQAAARDVEGLLGAKDATVRVEAAAALGGMARNVRARDPDARLPLAGALAHHVLSPEGAGAPSDDEIRARLWALAQLDEPAAFDAVRTAAAKSPRSKIRDWAARLVARPRQSLILR